MFFVQKRIEVAGAHRLKLPYKSKCKRLHGHNWIVTVYCQATDDFVKANNGMVVDFTKIKDVVMRLDHRNLCRIFRDKNPTAENIAKWICLQIDGCYKVSVQESEGNIATFEREVPVYHNEGRQP